MTVTAVIVQARMGSKRFPKKVMADLCGRPVLWHVLTRCQEIRGVDVVVLAVPDQDASFDMEFLAGRLGVKTFRGSENDVLSRYLGAARKYHADYIMRITADCPLIDPQVCSEVLAAVKRKGIAYASNVLPRTFEKGLDCEAFTRWSLELAAKNATGKFDREHVTPWIQLNPLLPYINVESGAPHRSEVNWCIDYPEDLERVMQVMARAQAA